MEAPRKPVWSPPGSARTDGDASADDIRADIVQTRFALGQTIDELRHRLNPRAILTKSTAAAKDAASRQAKALASGSRVAATALASRCDRGLTTMRLASREDPVPAALAGLSCAATLIALPFRMRRARRHAAGEPTQAELWNAVPPSSGNGHAGRAALLTYAMWATVACLASVGMRMAVNRMPNAATDRPIAL